ncbi:MAG TPA: metalloregulator ArsR/SmtB family transcription factor [Actinomycetota bacterium]|nr:metalloregulator ArsR/SmtB family transcription factor [Actinomycetota bacterium]
MVKFQRLDRTFAALADPTRRDILERLAHGPASISELAGQHRLSLPGVMKHVRILEGVDLVRSEKRGRTRQCRLGPGRLDEATRWIEQYRRQWERRLDRLEAYIEKRETAKR